MSLSKLSVRYGAIFATCVVIALPGCTYELPSMTGEPDAATIEPVNGPGTTDQIHTGSVPPSTPPIPGNLTVVQVKRGDSLSSIAQTHGVAWRDLASANQLEAPYEVSVGQTLVLPANAN